MPPKPTKQDDTNFTWQSEWAEILVKRELISKYGPTDDIITIAPMYETNGTVKYRANFRARPGLGQASGSLTGTAIVTAKLLSTSMEFLDIQYKTYAPTAKV